MSCELGCTVECKAKAHGCASDCPALPWQPSPADAHIAALEAAPTCWTLSDALDRGESTHRNYLWFSDPQNSCWEPLYRGKAVEAVLSELRDLREELAGEQARADMHADLGRRTAEALGLTPEEGRAHMPEVAAKLREEMEWMRKHANAQAVAASLAFDETAQRRAEVEALRADAGRYRWLRANQENLTDPELDAAIDAAIAKAEAGNA